MRFLTNLAGIRMYLKLQPLMVIGEIDQLTAGRALDRVDLSLDPGGLPVEGQDLDLPADALGDRDYAFVQRLKVEAGPLTEPMEKVTSHAIYYLT